MNLELEPTIEERRRYLAVEIEHMQCLLRDARKCKLAGLVESRRQKIIGLQKELRQLDATTKL